jgi:hypothetical protein
MSLKILTNNPRVLAQFTHLNQHVEFVEGHAKDVIEDCQHCIYNSWKLAADPLAGYFSRPNPYHTIFLQKGRDEKVYGEHLLRLKRTAEQWEKYDNVIPMTEKLWKDYEELDYSFAMSTLNGLLRNPVFYDCES